MKTKTFDCIQMKPQGAERIRKELEGKTPSGVAGPLAEGHRRAKETPAETSPKGLGPWDSGLGT
jgi:hypothetical protein